MSLCVTVPSFQMFLLSHTRLNSLFANGAANSKLFNLAFKIQADIVVVRHCRKLVCWYKQTNKQKFKVHWDQLLPPHWSAVNSVYAKIWSHAAGVARSKGGAVIYLIHEKYLSLALFGSLSIELAFCMAGGRVNYCCVQFVAL